MKTLFPLPLGRTKQEGTIYEEYTSQIWNLELWDFSASRPWALAFYYWHSVYFYYWYSFYYWCILSCTPELYVRYFVRIFWKDKDTSVLFPCRTAFHGIEKLASVASWQPCSTSWRGTSGGFCLSKEIRLLTSTLQPTEEHLSDLLAVVRVFTALWFQTRTQLSPRCAPLAYTTSKKSKSGWGQMQAQDFCRAHRVF